MPHNVCTLQGPVIDNLPKYFTIPEDIVNGYTLMTVTATDPEGDALSWLISAKPYDGGAFSIGAASMLALVINEGLLK